MRLSTEVKIVYAEVAEKLSVIGEAAASLNRQTMPSVLQNEMEAMQKLMALINRQEQLLMRYHKILQENLKTTEKSIESIRTLDAEIASTIDHAALGTEKVNV